MATSWLRGRKGSSVAALLALLVGAALGRAAAMEDLDLLAQETAVVQADAAEQVADIAELQTAVDELQEQLDDAATDAEERAADLEAAIADLDAAKLARSDAQEARDEAEGSLTIAEAQVDRLRDDLADREAEIEDQAVAISRLESAEVAEVTRAAPPQDPPPPPPPPPPPASAAASTQPFENCTAARAAGAAPVRRGEPGYGPHLDRDDDGIGCE